MLVNRGHHGDSHRRWEHSRRRDRTKPPIEDWKLVPKKPHGYLTALLRIDPSKYLPNPNIGQRVLKFGNKRRNHIHKVNYVWVQKKS